MLTVLLRIFKTEGISGFYRGFGATMLNTFSMRLYSSPSSSCVLTGPQNMLIFSFILSCGIPTLIGWHANSPPALHYLFSQPPLNY